MATRRAERLAGRYRTRREDLRARVDARLRALYGELVDPAAIADSYERFAVRAIPLIEAGQASAARMAAAFVASIAGELDDKLEIDVLDEEAIAGTTVDGRPLAAGMAAIAPMVLARIRDGAPVDVALAAGEHLTTRFAGSEVTNAGDRELAAQGREIGPLVGWEGIVAPDACAGCQANAGVHDLAWTPYRHGDTCQCVVAPVFAPS